MSESKKEYIEHMMDERKFIHDLASPLMIAMGMVDSVNNKIDDGDLKQRLEKSKAALDKMNTILRERRTKLIEILEKVETP